MKKTITAAMGTMFLIACFSCNRFLDVKPDQKLAIAKSMEQLTALLDYHSATMGSLTEVGEISSDDYYLPDDDWRSLWSDQERNMYLWKSENVFSVPASEWYYPYHTVFYANTILEGLESMPESLRNERKDEWDLLKGSAHYIRAVAFLNVASIWCTAYDPLTAESEMGIPLKTNSDPTETVGRGTLHETFAQIRSDLNTALRSLPATVPHKIRPSKASAHAWLARTYQYMGQTELAYQHADSCLRLDSKLTDFNGVISSERYTFARFGDEVLHENTLASFTSILYTARVDSALYASYDAHDLRKQLFFEDVGDGSVRFRGSYANALLFGGVATDEMYLIRAESLARMGHVNEAMESLNELLRHRYAVGHFQPRDVANEAEAINLILAERRKELLMRGLRWMDLKRLNKMGANITLKRNIDNAEYTLPPNDLRYAIPIPEDIVQLGGVTQNPR